MQISLSTPLRDLLRLDPINEPPAVHQSAVIQREKCGRAEYLSTVFGLRPFSRSPGRDEGSFMHIALAQLMSGHSWEDADRVTRVAMHAIIRDKRDHLQQRYPDADVSDEVSAEIARCRAVGFACARFLGTRLTATLEEAGYTIVSTETPFDVLVSLGGTYPPIRAAGRIDLIIADKQGRYWLWDYKSEGINVDDAAALYGYAVQPWLYTFGARAQFKRDYAGFHHAVVRKPGIRIKRIGRPDEQSLADYVRECHDWWTGTGEHLKRAPLLQSDKSLLFHPLVIPATMRETVAVRLMRYHYAYAAGDKAVWQSHAPVNLPEHEGSCRLGHIRCPFYKLCTSALSEWHTIAREWYTTVPDPLRAFAATIGAYN